MLNASSLNAVNSSRFSEKFIKPLYDSYCFANIPATILYLLTGEGQSALPADVLTNLPARYNKVVLFFIDAFGWRFFGKYAEKYPFLRTILQQGVVSKLTSQFPSTTAAHVTCINTGLNVGQSGVYEWNYYEPLVDDIITPLMFSYARDSERDTLKQAGIPPEAFYPRRTLHQDLQQRGIHSYIFQHQSYTPSTASAILFRGATEVHPFKALPDVLLHIAEQIVAEKSVTAYYLLYYGRFDTTCHRYGPESQQVEDEVDRFFSLLESYFYKKTRGAASDTLFILTADHGHLGVNPQTTIYLNRSMPGIERFLQTNAQGKLLVPAGSARDMFLHIKPALLDEAIGFLQKQLEGRAEVYRVEQLIGEHFFGLQEPSAEFRARVGNVVILPYASETVWWYEEGRFDMHFLGHHGGLTPEEMEIPLLVLPL